MSDPVKQRDIRRRNFEAHMLECPQCWRHDADPDAPDLCAAGRIMFARYVYELREIARYSNA